ncbi:MAG: TonB-dependent receptor plug domain-containing protein [Flavobacteriaceae bacterium]|jgi:outer membrane receptor for ferrienterochelin and colicins|nr:TonB-dependent receptor plug domain-containing protein [Flavobacteriaceae bacterium]
MKHNTCKKLLICSLLLVSWAVYSQDKDSLSTKGKEIEKIVITGQYLQQSIDKSIYQIEVISQEDIKNRAASTIADILDYNLNFVTIPSSTSGNSDASLFGLDSQYFKVLIDNIPLVSDNGMGGSVDLTKIDLDNVERIEIVRGSLGVDYGSNSLTGLINIITKKKIPGKWKISGYVQEETVGDEYDWKEKGKHIQSLDVAHNITDKWYVSVNANHNDFEGFFGEKEGKRHYKNEGGKRGYEWLPKEQWNAKALINFRSEKFSAFYKVHYLNEIVNYYNPIVNWQSLVQGVPYTYSSKDRDYKTDRWGHHLFLNATLFNRIDYKGDFSYQKQDREYRDYIYDIGKREVFGSKEAYKNYAYTDAWYTRGTFSRFLNSKVFDFQLGYEFNLVEGFRSARSNPLVGGSSVSGFKEDIKDHLDNYDVFVSGELRTNVGLSLRPGFRNSFNSKFDDQQSYSLSMKFELSKSSDIRAEVATTNRTPNFDELHTYFVNTNHDIQGNPDLVPEKGYSSAIHLNKRIKTESGFKAELNLSTLYINLDDKIELSITNLSPLKYRYLNVDKYKTWGVLAGSSLRYKNLSFSLGISYFGVSLALEDNINGTLIEEVPDTDYLYSLQLNSSLNYTIPKWKTTFSVYYKYNGKEPRYILNTDEKFYRLGEQDGYSLLDASIRKSLFKNTVELTVGARNLFNVKDVNTTAAGSGAHQGPVSSINLFYGRSYFVKLGFNLNI